MDYFSVVVDFCLFFLQIAIENGAIIHAIPHAKVPYKKQYGALSLKPRVKDLAGNGLSGDYTWQFTTVVAPGPEIHVKKGTLDIASGATNVHDFGSVITGNKSGIETFTVMNQGSLDLQLTSTPVVLSSNTEFVAESQPDTLIAGGGSDDFTLSFNPSGTGEKTATITIYNKDWDENPYTFTVKGTATAAPEPEIHVMKGITDVPSGTTNAHDFGNVIVGQTSSTVTFTVKNLGNAELNLTGTPRATSSSTEFSIDSQPNSPIGEGEETTLTVTFRPTGTGAKTTTITILNNDSNEGTYTFSIKGYGYTSGMLDESFSDDGYDAPNFSYNHTNYGYASEVQNGGKILVAGSCDGNILIHRYNQNGSLDTSFNGTGFINIDMIGGGVARAIKVDADGKIIVAGTCNDQHDFIAIRLNSNGTVDTSFGTSGKLIVSLSSLSSDYEGVTEVLLQNDGKIILSGNYTHDGTSDHVLIRSNSDGTLDSSFSDDGIQITDFGSYESITSASFQGNKIVVAGAVYPSDCDILLIRYNNNGSVDTTFGTSGRVITSLGTGNDAATPSRFSRMGKLSWRDTRIPAHITI